MSKKNSTSMLMVLFAAAFTAAFNENIINVGLSDVAQSFSIDTVTANWLVTGYMIVTAIVVTVVGFLLKRFRLRQIFFLGAGVLIVGSLGALVAPTFEVLLAFRLLQAVGTGIFTPTMMSTVLLVAPPKKVGTFMAVGSCCITFGPAFGPVISGLMVTLMGWRGMFVVPLVAMVVIAVAGAFFIYDVGEKSESRLDVVSLVLSAIGLTAFVYGISEVTTNLVLACALMVVGLVVIAGFVVRQGKVKNPMMNLEPMRSRRFTTACLMVAVAMMMTFSLSVLLPLYFEEALGVNALVAGLLVLIPVLAQALGALIGGRAFDTFGDWPLLPTGFAIILVGLIVCVNVSLTLSVVLVEIGAAVAFFGVGLCMSPSQTSGLRDLSPEMNPFGVSITSTFIQVAAAIGPSLFVGVLSSSQATALAGGSTAGLAAATGFSSALVVATAIDVCGLALSLVYALVSRRRSCAMEAAAN